MREATQMIVYFEPLFPQIYATVHEAGLPRTTAQMSQAIALCPMRSYDIKSTNDALVVRNIFNRPVRMY